jgi:hypothetical protein
MTNSTDLNASSHPANWRFWSTKESVRNRQPSVMAVMETCVAPILYIWLASHVGWLLPLYLAVAVAPLVLLRTEQSIALAVSWATAWEWDTDQPRDPPMGAFIVFALSWLGASLIAVKLWGPPFSEGGIRWAAALTGFFFLPLALLIPLVLLLSALVIRVTATAMFWREGLENLPNNFRTLILCVSPSQIPELIPDLQSPDSFLTFSGLRRFISSAGPSALSACLTLSLVKLISRTAKNNSIAAKLVAIQPLIPKWIERVVTDSIFIIWAIVVFAPSWAYRITIKSTIWFWWPLVFIGGDLRLARLPDLLHWTLMGSLWAKTSILVACLSLITFIFTNVFLDGTFFENNPLITPIGYFLLIDWNLQPWQVCAISASAMSIVLVFWMNDIAGRLRIAKETSNTDLYARGMGELGWMERFARVRVLLVLSFWILVGAHALLYFNAQTCAVSLSDNVQNLAQAIYGNRTPKSICRTN